MITEEMELHAQQVEHFTHLENVRKFGFPVAHEMLLKIGGGINRIGPSWHPPTCECYPCYGMVPGDPSTVCIAVDPTRRADA